MGHARRLSESPDIWSAFDLPARTARLSRLDAESARPDFWDDAMRAQDILREASTLRNEIEKWQSIERRARSLAELADLALAENESGLQADLQAELDGILGGLEGLEAEAMLSGPHDGRSAILSFQAGAGGIDSQDWAQMLITMFRRWGEAHGHGTRILDWTDGDEAGIKRADLEIDGQNVYGYLKGEAGVHRLIRLSPFDNQHQRHTSFALVEVLPIVDDAPDVAISPDDLRVDTFRSSGAGGQNVQKNETAVRLTHFPTGIVVSVQNERSQGRNREIAMRILLARLTEREMAKRREEEMRLRGEFVAPQWGNQIRTYVLHPYKMVKDHRTSHEEADPDAVLGGELDPFLMTYMRGVVGVARRLPE